ncbi:hypothetical protein FIA58_018805 [Flavobacterium jejuense]|uniref:Uncharacterized protein n=1 Tax=Flavobacterium jejuense TaxID=1544455 RepID=A0ABX0IV93_9FLAO|nr:hypothetical protein [Flavobacterium jejuense]NHN27737.1 hypothetical protein [Flavobacterium jejuense]
MNNTLTNEVAITPTEELTNYHQQLLEQFNDPKFQVVNNADTLKLIPFNGYYTLDSATGAFFAIDTNMVITPTTTEPQYDLSLLISLDGTTSKRYKFTGTFDGNQLLQDNAEEGLGLSLTFSRNSSTYGPTVSCKGSIILLGQQALHVKGTTYNNPIPASLYKGDYFYTPIIGQPPVKVMSIGDNNTLLYDNGTNNGELHPVKTYIYNLNMYYFSIETKPYTQVKLIMGTAATQGFACNNMSIIGNNLTTRSLTTIPTGPTPKSQIYDLSGITLADFSGYYQIPSKEYPKAFVSIQAQYISTGAKMELELNFVMISYSLDGKTSFGHYFDPLLGMTFDTTTNTLTVPSTLGKPELVLTFNREYKPCNEISGSLVSVTGNIDDTLISGTTLFNPVPLHVFGGVTMTSKDGDEQLTINNDNSITYVTTSKTSTNNVKTINKQTKTFDSIIYVPLMYIVAAPADAPTLELSLGTDGLRGNVSIVITDINTPSPKTSSVNAINGPE